MRRESFAGGEGLLILHRIKTACPAARITPQGARTHETLPCDTDRLPAVMSSFLEIRFPWIDPVALDLPGPVDLRWYGLTYLAAFTIGALLLRTLRRAGTLRLTSGATSDLVFAIILGVLIGGRLGYILFYDLRDTLAEPLSLLRVWEGGMSFHGGLLGVAVALVWFARRRRVPFLHLADALALVAPFGIFFVRLANFINGELYGRLASLSVPWAMRFPTDPAALRLLGAEGLSMRQRELRIEAAYESGLWDSIGSRVPLRHPSQLYEALAEGVLLAALLWSVYRWRARSPLVARRNDGPYSALFLIGYGAARVVIELFREPDAQFRGPGDPLGSVLGPMTMGQVLSMMMIVAGVILLVIRRRAARGDAVE